MTGTSSQLFLLLVIGATLAEEPTAAPPALPGPAFYFPVRRLRMLVPEALPKGTALLRTAALRHPARPDAPGPVYTAEGAPPWLVVATQGHEVVLHISTLTPPVLSNVSVMIHVLEDNTWASHRKRVKYPFDTMTLLINVLDDDSSKALCTAENVSENLCFWPSVNLRVLEESPSVQLAPAGPTYLQHFCGKTFQYVSDDDPYDSGLALIKDEQEAWHLSTSRPLDREADTNATEVLLSPAARTRLLCWEVGDSHRIVSNDTATWSPQVDLIDRDDNPPILQNLDRRIYLETNTFVQGSQYAKSELLLRDPDSSLDQLYVVSVEEDASELWAVQCSPPTELLHLWPYPTALTQCYLTPKENRTVEAGTEQNVTVRVMDTTMERLHSGLQNTVQASLALVAGARPLPPVAAGADAGSAEWPPRFPALVQLARWVAPLARVAQPRRRPSAEALFSLEVPALVPEAALAVTPRHGIVYVRDPNALAGAPALFTIRVRWRPAAGKSDAAQATASEGGVDLRVRLQSAPRAGPCAAHIHAAQQQQHVHCADLSRAQQCQAACGLGAGAASPVPLGSNASVDAVPTRDSVWSACVWRSTGPSQPHAHANYSTCTPDALTCPDGRCDELELANPYLCPQDCLHRDANSKHMAFNAHGRGIAKAPGVCTCSSPVHCVCLHEPPTPAPAPLQHSPPPPPPPIPPPPPPDAVPLGRAMECGTSCLLALTSGGTLLLVTAAATALALRRCRSSGKGRCARRMTSPTAASSVTSSQRHRLSPTSACPAPAAPAAASTAPEHSCDVQCWELPPADPRWEFPRRQLVLEQPLGEGEFGRVLRARALNIAGRPGYSTVAVKTLKAGACASELADLLSEFALLKQVSHPNVVRLLGACSAGCAAGEPFLLIMEFALHGSLRGYLRRRRRPPPAPPALTPRDVLTCAWHVAKGMAYLSDMKLIHRDLAARNVLVAEGGVCKISDFGLTRDVYEDDTYLKRSKGRVPVKWMSLESLADHLYTSKSDVWSYGVLLWELVTLGSSPYPGVAVHNLFHLLKSGYRMQCPENCSPAVYRIMRLCWQENSDDRPSFKELTTVFEKMLEDGVDYLDFNPHTVHNMTYFTSLSSSNDDLDNSQVHYENRNILPTGSDNNLESHIPRKEKSLCLTNLTLTCSPEEEEKLLDSSNDTTPVDSIDLQKSMIGINDSRSGEISCQVNSYLSPIHHQKSKFKDFTTNTSSEDMMQCKAGISLDNWSLEDCLQSEDTFSKKIHDTTF